MMRFAPDGVVDAVSRPFSMALPQAWVYTEIIAPDMRFAISVVLLLGVAWYGFKECCQPLIKKRVVALIALVVLSFPAWLLSGGNGRYYMPIFLLIGPLIASLWSGLNVRQDVKYLYLAVVAVAQFLAISTNSPWAPFQSLEWVRWVGRDYFDLNVKPISHLKNVTYVTVTGQSTSIVAPLFPADSSWMNLTSFSAENFLSDQRDVVAEARRRLAVSHDLRLVIRAQPRQADIAAGLPNESAATELRNILRPYGLNLLGASNCELLRSRSMAALGVSLSTDTEHVAKHIQANSGLWVCKLEWRPTAAARGARASLSSRIALSYKRIEQQCPRLFPEGRGSGSARQFGYERSYPDSESSVFYVADSDMFYVKMDRALNPQSIGTASQVLAANFELDCHGFIGREGLIWKRGM